MNTNSSIDKTGYLFLTFFFFLKMIQIHMVKCAIKTDSLLLKMFF
jgi:hypothetical protein